MLCSRERAPKAFSSSKIFALQFTALRALGERESETGRLEEAVAAYREALQEDTRDRVPLRWAMIQSNLAVRFGYSASARAGRRGSKRPLPPFARPCRKGPARAPLQWAKAQMNLALIVRFSL